MDLLVDGLARLCELEAPADLRSGQDRVALGDAQRLRMVGHREFVAVIKVRLHVRMAVRDEQQAVPQRSRRKGVDARAADLEVEAGIRFDEALIGWRAVEPDLAVGA